MPAEQPSSQSRSHIALVCGSRDWPAPWFVTAKMIEHIAPDWTVLTGGARGADAIAHMEATRLGYATKVMPADWDRHGKRAGYLRNLAMLDQGPALVLAFSLNGSKGTAHTIHEARRRGIEVRSFTQDDLRPSVLTLDMGDVA